MNRKIRIAIVFEYIKVLLPLVALTWMSIDSSVMIMGLWETIQIVLIVFSVVVIKYHMFQREKRIEIEEGLGLVIRSRSDSAVFWDALTLAVSKSRVKRPELRKYEDDQRTHGVCTWLGFGKYVVGLNEELESIPEDANAVAAHEVAHQILKHSVLQMWMMVMMNIILAVNIILFLNTASLYLAGEVHLLIVAVCALLAAFVFYYSRLTRTSVELMVEHTAWLKAIDLIGLNPIVHYLMKSAAMTVDIEVDSAGNMRQRVGFSQHALTLARIDWLEPYYENPSSGDKESEG